MAATRRQNGGGKMKQTNARGGGKGNWKVKKRIKKIRNHSKAGPEEADERESEAPAPPVSFHSSSQKASPGSLTIGIRKSHDVFDLKINPANRGSLFGKMFGAIFG